MSHGETSFNDNYVHNKPHMGESHSIWSPTRTLMFILDPHLGNFCSNRQGHSCSFQTLIWKTSVPIRATQGYLFSYGILIWETPVPIGVLQEHSCSCQILTCSNRSLARILCSFRILIWETPVPIGVLQVHSCSFQILTSETLLFQ